jgi:salicylate hydroxylase
VSVSCADQPRIAVVGGGIGGLAAAAFLGRAGLSAKVYEQARDGWVLSAENLAESCERLYGERTYTSHRADLLSVVQAAVPEGSVRLGMRCVRVEIGDDGGVADLCRRHPGGSTTRSRPRS